MRNFLCWEPEKVHEVINIDADFVPDEVFAAVHCDVPLRVRSATEGSPTRTLSGDALLQEFVDPQRRHYQLAVLGQTGSGKSHLIHWLRRHLPNDSSRVTIPVRRVETNLRQILDKLIQHLPSEQQLGFRDEIERTGTTLNTREAQKRSLLNNIVVSISQDQVRADSGLQRDLEEFLIDSLPNLLMDPQLLQDKLLRDNEIVDQLARRLFSTRGGRREAERLEFDETHLPLRNVHRARASRPAQDAINGIMGDEEDSVAAAVNIINRNLSDAIALTMNFSGDRLNELMVQLRTALATEGKELILLFEEFARFQGYDAPLLQALLVQGGNGLCNIRWAIACTTGFYQGLPDTARSRMDAVVDMDKGEEEQRTSELVQFAGRYLNAVRWGRNNLGEMFQDDPAGDVPNRCSACQNRPCCHSAFGSSPDGYGLYPFTGRALALMLERAQVGGNGESMDRFNPRTFQRSVLNPLLTDGGRAIRADAFPTEALHHGYGGQRTLTPLQEEVLTKRYGAIATRYIALLDLWVGSFDGSMFAPEFYGAFGLEPLDVGQTPPAGPTARPTRMTLSAEEVVPPGIQELRNWPRGGALSQRTAQALRERLFRAVNRYIDWDGISLVQTHFAHGARQGSKPFGNATFNFVRQETTPVVRAVEVELPFAPDDQRDFNRTAIALEGLLEVERHGGWTFADSDAKLTELLNLIERCAERVIQQLITLEGRRDAWDPVSSATELLILIPALEGKLNPRESMAAGDIFGLIFARPQGELAIQDSGLRQLWGGLRDKHPALVTFVRAHCSGTKGGQAGAFLDSRRPLDAIEMFLQANWRLQRAPPQRAVMQFYREIGELYGEVARDLPAALSQEWQLRKKWLERVNAVFWSKESHTIVETARKVDEAVHRAGLHVRNLPGLRVALDEFAGARFDDAYAANFALVEAGNDTPLPYYGQGDAEAVAATDKLIVMLEKVNREADTALRAIERQLGVDGGQRVDQAVDRIRKALDSLESDLAGLEASPDV